MEPIYLSELVAASQYAAVSNLSVDITESGNMTELIDNFVADANGALQGDAWTAVKEKLGEYSTALGKRVELAGNLSKAVSDALKLLIDYMEDYPYLDYSKYEEIEASYHQCELDIASINGALEAKTPVETTVNGVKKTSYVYVIQGGDRIALQTKIGEINESMAEIKALLTKLDGLEEVYNQAKGMLDEAFAEVDKFGTMVSEIVPSEKVQYIPAS